jgi:hypothetical protein
VAQLLAERTVAGGEGGLEYLATAAGATLLILFCICKDPLLSFAHRDETTDTDADIYVK